MTARDLEPERLTGRFITLSPITEADLPGLQEAIGVPEVFASGYGGGPAGYRESRDEFVEFARSYYVWDGPGITFVARLAAEDGVGRVVGTSTLSDIELKNETLHLGWTAWSPDVWGGVVNPEAKLLMIDFAFAHGFGRVRLQADSVNARSRAAMLKLGATYEGITRRHMQRADGSWRDSAIYSVLVDEWPAIRAGLLARLDTAA